MRSPLVEVEDLVMHFPISSGMFRRGGGVVHALDGVSLAVYEGETLGLVGESGCGKSTFGRTVLRLYEPTAGTIRFEGHDITRLSRAQLRPLRPRMQMVFQDPFASLNPRKQVSAIVGDVLRVHGEKDKTAVRTRVAEMLERVGLGAHIADRYARELSGGQRQRVGIARALALQPKLLIADEPVSALDVSVQAQVINLLDDLQDEFRLTYVIIAHDLGVIRHVSDRIGVMYLGKLVELGVGDEVHAYPVHPYTEALLSAVPIPDPVKSAHRKHIVLEGDIPSPLAPPSGCRFRTRCPYATEICAEQEPPLVEHRPGHLAACHHPRNVDLDAPPSPVAAADLPPGPAGDGAAPRPTASP